MVRFTLTFREFASALWAVSVRRPTMRIIGAAGLICVVLGLVLQSYVFWLGMYVIVGGLIGFAVAPLIRWRQTRLMRDEQVHTFAEDSVTVAVKVGESRVLWQFYERAYWTGDLYLLMHTWRQFNLIPRRAFASPQEEAVFRSLLTAYGAHEVRAVTS